MKKIAVITGASTGLGREFVRIIKDKREIDEIWAIARHRDKLDKLRRQMGAKVIPISMDLSDPARIEELGHRLAQSGVEICYLINNAGYAKFCSYGDLSVADSLNMINLNIGGVVAMGLTCIPYMPVGSHIINIASQAAFQPLPYQNLYSSTKAFCAQLHKGAACGVKGPGDQRHRSLPGLAEDRSL